MHAGRTIDTDAWIDCNDPDQSTLSLLRANLAEAQRLQTAIAGTAQGTAATLAALAQQISNLQTLVTNVQAVVQQGLSFTLGVIGGANIVVTSANIGDVDRLILAALQSLANPSTGSGLNGAQASNPACLATEASAFATAMTSGGGNMDQLAQSLLAATQTSTACGTSSAFGSAYQIFGGAAGVGLGIANGSGVVATKLPGAALFGATTSNASTAVGLNALISPALASQTSSVKSTIAGVAAQSNPTTNQLLAKTTGALATNLSGAQNVTTASSTSSGIQKAKNLINALNSDAGLVTGANAPPAILASFKEQFDAITKSMQLFATCCSGPVTRSFAYGTVTVTSVKVGNTATYTVLVTPTAGGSYTSVWVLTENVSGTVTTASGSVSGNMMPISTGASATIVSGSVSWTQNTAPNSTSTLNLSNFTLAIANNGKGSAEALSLNNLTFTDTLNATGNNFVSASAGGTLTATFGPSIYNITISVSATGNPVTSGSLTVTYGGPNGAFAFADQMTVSGNFATQVWSITQGTINLGGTVGPYDTTKAKPTFPSTFTVYDGTTQIGSYSYKTVSFVDGTFISLTF